MKKLFLCLLLATMSIAAQAKMDDCDGSTLEMVECLARKVDLADAKLNQVYQQVIAAARQQAQDMNNEMGSDEVEEKIRIAQRSWNDWRAKECEAQAEYQFTGGSGRNLAHMACMLDMLEERIDDLQAMAEN